MTKVERIRLIEALLVWANVIESKFFCNNKLITWDMIIQHRKSHAFYCGFDFDYERMCEWYNQQVWGGEL